MTGTISKPWNTNVALRHARNHGTWPRSAGASTTPPAGDFTSVIAARRTSGISLSTVSTDQTRADTFTPVAQTSASTETRASAQSETAMDPSSTNGLNFTMPTITVPA